MVSPEEPWGIPGVARGARGGSLGYLWESLGNPWGSLRVLRPWGSLGIPGGSCEGPWGSLRRPWVCLVVSLGGSRGWAK